jgi:integrase
LAVISYMQRRESGTYEFRRRLPRMLAGKLAPAHLRDDFSELINAKTKLFKREYVRSLRTSDTRIAKTRDHQEALKFDRLLKDALAAFQQSPDPHSAPKPLDLKELGESVYRQLLAEDDAERLTGDDRRRLGPSAAERADAWPLLSELRPASAIGMEIDHAEMYGLLNEDLSGEYREAFARRDPSIVSAETSIELKRRGILWDKTSEEFQAAALVVLKAHVRAYDDIGKRQQGADIPTPIEAPKGHRGPKISEAFAVWKAGGRGVRGARTPAEKTITEATLAVRYLTDLFGDIRVGDITRARAREYSQAVEKVPARLPKHLRKMALPKLLQEDLSGLPPRHAKTINKYLQLMGGIVTKAESEAMLDGVDGFANPFTKAVKIEVEEGDENDREIFSPADLQAIFTSPVFAQNWRTYAGAGEAAFWFPVVALLSGMRLAEIAQLRLCDLSQDEHDGVWFFNVGRKGGRRTKTTSSIRRIPIHPALKRIGLLKYREWVVSGGAKANEPLWPGVNPSAWSKWVNPYLRKQCGITDSNKVFHSFRHTFKRMARDAELQEELHDALTGHTGKGKSVGRDYGAGFSIKPLGRAMARIKPPPILEALHWSVPKP